MSENPEKALIAHHKEPVDNDALTPAQEWIIQFTEQIKNRPMQYPDNSYDDSDGYSGDTGCSWE